MSLFDLNLLKLLFLFGFTLHNLEESIWLPEWSKQAGNYHKPIERNAFVFAVICITVLGILLTALDVWVGGPGRVVTLVYLGFVGMMGLNALFPHLLATIVLKRYAPGLLTGLLLNLPLSILIISVYKAGFQFSLVLFTILLVSLILAGSLRYLFALGNRFITFNE